MKWSKYDYHVKLNEMGNEKPGHTSGDSQRGSPVGLAHGSVGVWLHLGRPTNLPFRAAIRRKAPVNGMG